MPFLGQDPRGPGFCWHKSDTTPGCWSVFESNSVILEATPKSEVRKALGAYLQQVLDKKHRALYTTLSAAPDSKSSVKENQKWIQIGIRGSKEIHGYTTIGELIRRLDFEAATKNQLRFRYILRVVELLVFYRLTSLGGSALTHLFDLIEQCLNHVLVSCVEIRSMRRLLECLMASLQRQSRDHIFSSKVLWLRSIARVRNWQTTLNQIRVPRRVDFGLTLSDLPWEIQHKVAMSLTDDCDVISLSQVSPTFNVVCEENSTWKNLCYVNFSQMQIRKVIREIKEGDGPPLPEMMHTDGGSLPGRMQTDDEASSGQVKDCSSEDDEPSCSEWKTIYFALKSQFELMERNYQHGLLLCKCCSILFWEECGHPCIRPSTDPGEVEQISPVKLLTLF